MAPWAGVGLRWAWARCSAATRRTPSASPSAISSMIRSCTSAAATRSLICTGSSSAMRDAQPFSCADHMLSRAPAVTISGALPHRDTSDSWNVRDQPTTSTRWSIESR